MEPQPQHMSEKPLMADAQSSHEDSGTEPEDLTSSMKEPYDALGTIVAKIGGSTLGEHDTTLRDLITLQKKGINSVVVHGGCGLSSAA